MKARQYAKEQMIPVLNGFHQLWNFIFYIDTKETRSM